MSSTDVISWWEATGVTIATQYHGYMRPNAVLGKMENWACMCVCAHTVALNEHYPYLTSREVKIDSALHFHIHLSEITAVRDPPH
jgi:hypothetical protein